MTKQHSIFHSLEIIERRIEEKLTVETIANVVYFSKYHYSRLFRELVGDSVMEYVTKRKLTLAGKALLESNDTILEIALRFGYDSHEGFTRSFKSYMGVTPTDYRKYRLCAISQKVIKEDSAMNDSKNTHAIIRELNAFIAKARETANAARNCREPVSAPFWKKIAVFTDAFADNTQNTLESITRISEQPDEITNRFAILKVLEHTAFQTNLLNFNVGLMASRGLLQYEEVQKPLCEKFALLAKTADEIAEKSAEFFNELAALIFEDMRNTAAEKIQFLIRIGKSTVEQLRGYSYIQNELGCLVDTLASVPIEKLNLSLLEDLLLRLDIIAFSADMDSFRNPEETVQFQKITEFREVFSETVAFFQTLIIPESNPAAESHTQKHAMDISHQSSILLFYIRGEISEEKLGRLLDTDQKEHFVQICEKIDALIHFTQNVSDESAYPEIADKITEITSALLLEADDLKERGGAIRFLAEEFGKIEKHL